MIPHEECGADGLCVKRTTTPEDIFDITREATERIEATDNDRLNQLILQLAGITEGKRATVTDLINGIGDVSAAITARDGQAGRRSSTAPTSCPPTWPPRTRSSSG